MDAAYLFNTGQNYEAYKFLGSFKKEQGYDFRVYAPSAQRVFVTGSFCDWDQGRHEMHRIGETGIFELSLDDVPDWSRYKYVIVGADGEWRLKQDPFARHQELRPGTASICYPQTEFEWTDAEFIKARDAGDARNLKPLNIYECHLGSWRKYQDGHYFDYRRLAVELAEYLTDMGYNALEILPVMEYPLDDSWGYQVTGYFAPTSRYGTPEDFAWFVNHLHEKGIRVILDWVPGHFPKDDFALARFDGSPCYEYADTRIGEHKEWGTLVFNYGKSEVVSFLLSSAWYWLQEFHLDGLRVDAVSSMIYLNYDRTEFLTNCYGGTDHLEALDFLRQLNQLVRQYKPGVIMAAEEATTYPGLTRDVEEGGLGFTHKWNMGWMHDSLDYVKVDYYARRYYHNKLTFPLTYAFSERYILPLSHDEVVHGKKSLIGRMPGDIWRQCASLRTLFVWQIAHPGAVLNFMGAEFGQFIEWRFKEELEWFMMEYPLHQKIQDFVRDLNHLYLREKALFDQDQSWEGFRWIAPDDASHSVYVFERIASDGEKVLVILNMTPAVLRDYRIPLEYYQPYEVLINSDDACYGGSSFWGEDSVAKVFYPGPQDYEKKQAERAQRYQKEEKKREKDQKKRDQLIKARDAYQALLFEGDEASRRLAMADVFNLPIPELPPISLPDVDAPYLCFDLPPLSAILLKPKTESNVS